jgi:hypothetical protein
MLRSSTHTARSTASLAIIAASAPSCSATATISLAASSGLTGKYFGCRLSGACRCSEKRFSSTSR